MKTLAELVTAAARVPAAICLWLLFWWTFGLVMKVHWWAFKLGWDLLP